MDQDVDISPNATPSEIGEELVFQSALLESLDPEAFNYQEEKDKIERMMEALQTRLEAISPPTPNNFEDGMDMLPDFTIGFDGYYDGEGNDDDTLAGSLPGPFFLDAPSRKRPSDNLENLEKTKSRRTTPAPSPHPAASPASSLSDLDAIIRPAVSARQISSQARVPRGSVVQQAIEQQRAHEQRKAQELEDERLAKQLQSGTNRPAFGSRPQLFGGSSQSVLNRDGTFRKMVKPSSLHNVFPTETSNNMVNGGGAFGSYLPATMQSNFSNGGVKSPGSYVQNASQSNFSNGDSGPVQGAIGTTNFGFGYDVPSNVEPLRSVKAEDSWAYPSFSNPSPLKKELKAEPSGSNSDWAFSTPRSLGFHASSSSSSLEEITPEDFLATSRRRSGGGLVNSTFTNIPVRTSAAPVSGYGQPIQRHATGFSSSMSQLPPLGSNGANATGMGPSHAQYGAFGSNVSQLVRNVANRIGHVLPSVKSLNSPHNVMGMGSSLNGGYNANFLQNLNGNALGSQGYPLSQSISSNRWYPGGNPAAELSYLTGLTSATPIDLEEEYPDRSRYDYLYSDPTRTAEEIKALLENIRSDEDLPPEMRAGTPDEMSAVLMEHQKLGLTWLKKQEEGTNKGGILADDMGLGKTIQAIALMVSRRSDNPRRKTNLIVAPVALLRQWEAEIADKVKTRYALKVFRHHGQAKKASFQKLREYDVVLTTFGTLAAEYKRREKWLETLKLNPEAIPSTKERLALLGDECLWYRVIIDEAQCIKNRNSMSAKAAHCLNSQYRICMTGTPMMNNVLELYSLIHFCRIRPFNSFETFQLEIGTPMRNGSSHARSKAMQKLQGLIRAIMIRRTKKSTLDGKPLITLPERTTNMAEVEFTEDETDFYKALEQQTRLQYNKYLKAGTVGKNYSCILVLLLRLRQACCHPHLIKDFGVALQTDVDPETMIQLAKELDDDVVARIKEADGAFACPICLDAVENPAIFIPCGHDSCSECFSRLTDPARGLATGAENGPAETRCPQCRGKIDPKRITDFLSFQKAHQPELVPEEEPAKAEVEELDSDNSDSEDESDDETSSLEGFIVNDDVEDDDKEEDNKPATGKGKTKAKNPKGKEKAKDKKPRTLAQLRKEGLRNKKAHKRYMRRLERDWQTSTKIEKTLALLKVITENHPREKILIFSQFTSFLDLLEVPLHRGEYAYRRYDGSMTANERSAAVNYFKESQVCKIMLVSLKAGNAGLNLNCASHVILEDPFWNPYVEEQAIDRAHRIGQRYEVQVHRIIVQDTVEERILTLQKQKRDLVESALDENAGRSISRLGTRELSFLFGLSRSSGAAALANSAVTPAS